MSALFSSYEQELTSLVTSLKARSTNAIDERFTEDLREAQALITQLDIEARAANAGQEVRARVQRLKDDIKALADRAALFQGARKETRPSGSLSRFVEDEEALDRSEANLLEARRTLMETESVASGINEDLLSHRAKIQSARDKLLHTGGLLGRAHRTMRIMQSRDVQRKLCVYGAVAFVVFMFLAFVISTLFPSSSKGNDSTPAPTIAITLSPTTSPPS